MPDQQHTAHCCAPARTESPTTRPAEARTGAAPAWVGTGTHGIEQAQVPAGEFAMGDAHDDGQPTDGEGPVHQVALPGFEIDATCVTVADFAAFVEATGYRTEAEEFGCSAVFHLAVRAPADDVLGASAGTPWWLAVKEADWRRPGGRRSDAYETPDHPVTHVSWHDAAAYCAWAGRALPTEAQWEYAARGGLAGARYPWGDVLRPDGAWRCNIWQGTFPVHNTMADGYLTTAPVRAFEPNGYGLWQTVGNVWEWCADRFSPVHYTSGPVTAPTGPEEGNTRVMRGGSYLCHDSYCNRYRVAARSSNTPDSATANLGFRTVGRP
ncbi:formylglycine-generating enzyme family protein [Streptomyces xiaopingdaonensis]|uniref:formylglycine-generating enzyme family protein n=1 Tax=Streptomyces xiaopingdaonensis TaxID=1565415 RepID=UPI0002EE3D02|nr:formylglycine-generating enzyme family protein [Streptomyces xiaopingdaonensis]